MLTVEVIQKQTKRSVDENQVAKKIDYKIIIKYSLSDIKEKNAIISQIAKLLAFSFTPKSSGYNFASDVFFENLLKEAVLENVGGFMNFANSS